MWPSMFIVIEKGKLHPVTRIIGTLDYFSLGKGLIAENGFSSVGDLAWVVATPLTGK